MSREIMLNPTNPRDDVQKNPLSPVEFKFPIPHPAQSDELS